MTPTGSAAPEVTSDREIVLARTFDAPRDRVWRAWTEPEHLARWFGPDGFATTVHEMDVRVGGVTREARDAAVQFGAVELGYRTLGRLAGYMAAM